MMLNNSIWICQLNEFVFWLAYSFSKFYKYLFHKFHCSDRKYQLRSFWFSCSSDTRRRPRARCESTWGTWRSARSAATEESALVALIVISTIYIILPPCQGETGVYLTCQARGKPGPSVRWLKDNVTVSGVLLSAAIWSATQCGSVVSTAAGGHQPGTVHGEHDLPLEAGAPGQGLRHRPLHPLLQVRWWCVPTATVVSRCSKLQ